MKTQIINILKDARNLIKNPNNWIKMERKQGDKYCLIGSVCYAGTRNAYDSNAYTERAYKELNTTLKNKKAPFGGPITFNDNPNTTHEDVIRLISSTIKRLQKQNKNEQTIN